MNNRYSTLAETVRSCWIDRWLAPAIFGFVITACRNRFLDDVRSAKRRRLREVRAVGRPVAGTDPADGVGHDATDAMRSLPAEQRAAMVLRYVDDLPVAEVARQLGRSVHATESLLARAKATLRTRLGGTRP